MNNRETNEIWRPIKGFPRYLVSDQGRVKSFTSPKHPEGKILKPTRTQSGYLTVYLKKGNTRGKNDGRTCFVHRLVAEAFIPVPNNLRPYGKKNLQVDHIIPLLNSGTTTVDNLRWATRIMNQHNEHTLENIRKAMEKRKQPVYVYDEELVQVSAFTSTAEAARILGKSQGNIASSCTGALPRYLGRIWSYTELTDMSQRKELEEKMHYQFVKNRKSTAKAVLKWYPKGKAQGKLWYQNHTEEMRERSRRWYYEHRDEILGKKQQIREKNQQEQA